MHYCLLPWTKLITALINFVELLKVQKFQRSVCQESLQRQLNVSTKEVSLTEWRVTFPVGCNDNCVYCAFLGWQPDEFSISLFQRHCSKTNIDESRKLHGCTSKYSSGIVWLPSASVNALNTWAQFNDKKNEAEVLPSGFTFHGFIYLVVRFNFSSTGELKTVNNLRVAPCVPASTGHTTPCHSAVSGSVATTHSLTPLAAAAKNSKMCVFQIYTLDLLIE